MIVDIYKEKGYIQDCGNHRGLGKKQLSEKKKLVSCQVKGRRMQYLRCGTFWRNSGGN